MSVPKKEISWGKAKKKPVEVQFRKVTDGIEIIHTLEGDLIARSERDFIIKGVNGEEYPIRKTIFYKTYDVLITADGEATKGYHDVEEFYKNE